MSRLRIHRSFEEELAKKADEFSLQPKAGSWHAIDQSVQKAARTQKLWKFAGLSSSLLLVAVVFFFSTGKKNPQDAMAEKPEMDIPAQFIPPSENLVNSPVSRENILAPKSEKRAPSTSEFTPVSFPSFNPDLPNLNEESPEIFEEKMEIRSVEPKHIQLALDLEQQAEKLHKRKGKPLIPRDGWHIQASLTPSFAFRSMNARIDNARPLEATKKAYDKGIQTYNAKIQARYHFTNRFSAAIGLAYSEYGESIGLAPRRESTIYDGLAAQYGYQPENMKRPGTETGFVNSFRFIQLPATLYFRRNLGNPRMHLSTGAGLSLGYLYSNTSMVYDFRVEHYVDNQKFLRDWNISAHLISLFEFNVNTRWTIQAGPEFNYSLLSTYQNYYTLTQHQYSLGMNFGLQWKVFNLQKGRGQKLQ